MQALYKLFVSDRELINNFPIFMSKRSKKAIKIAMKYMRKQLFIIKMKRLFGIKYKSL